MALIKPRENRLYQTILEIIESQTSAMGDPPWVDGQDDAAAEIIKFLVREGEIFQ